MKKLLIFDLDGTLLDTLSDLADSVNFALSSNGFPTQSEEAIRSFIGNGVRKLCARAIPNGEKNEKFNAVFASFRARYARHCFDKTKPYPNIVPLLEKLKAEGFSTAVVSNKADEAVQLLNEKFFPSLRLPACGEKAGIRKKPAPDSTLFVMKKLGFVPQDCVYIGDSEVDIETAENAGIPCISVTWGFRSKEELLQNGAKLLANSAEELEEKIKEIFSTSSEESE